MKKYHSALLIIMGFIVALFPEIQITLHSIAIFMLIGMGFIILNLKTNDK